MKFPNNRLLHSLIAAVIIAAALLSYSGSYTECHAQQQQDDAIQANLENVLLEDFIRFISQYTGRNIVYRKDQIPAIKFNIYSHKAMTEPELMAIFQQVLNNAGLSAVSKDNAVFIYPLQDAQKIGGTFRPSLAKQGEYGDELVTSVYQLRKNISAQTAVKALKGLASQVGNVTAIPQAQAIVITDTQDRLRNIYEIIRSIEALGSKWDFEVIQLKEATAEKVIKVLQDMYKELKARGEVAEGLPLLSAVSWSNSILISGTPEQKNNIKGFLTKLDKVDDEDEGVIRIYRLQNAKADTLAKVLRTLLTAQIQEKKKKQEERVVEDAIFQVSADTKTNAIIVLSSKDMFPQIEKIIGELDQPMDQVFVEVMVMETTLNNARRFGVEWMVGGGNKNNLAQTGFLDNDSPLMQYADPAFDGDPPAFQALPGGFSLGVLGNMITYGDNKFPTVNALVNFSKNINEINILSTPQLMTLDHSEAEVFVGENRPYVTSTKFDSNNNPVQTFDYRDVGVKLKITPHINKKDGLIRLEVYQEVKKLSTADTSTTQPTTLNRYTKTEVQIPDGATMVISGLIKDDQDRGKVGMPGLASIPVLGWLFKRENGTFEKTTMMVFISARVISTLDTATAITKAKQAMMDDEKARASKAYKNEFSWGAGDEDEEAEQSEETSNDKE